MTEDYNPEERFQKTQFSDKLPRYVAANNKLAKLRLFENGWETYLRPFVRKWRDKLREILGR